MTGIERFLVHSGLAAIFAAMLAGCLFGLLKRRVSLWILLIPLLAIVLVLLADVNWRTVSIHGFYHLGIVYEIFERGLPPEIPLMAGHDLNYSYGHHLLIATLMKYVPVSPVNLFAATTILSLVLTVFVLERAAKLISPDRVYRAMAVTLALFLRFKGFQTT